MGVFPSCVSYAGSSATGFYGVAVPIEVEGAVGVAVGVLVADVGGVLTGSGLLRLETTTPHVTARQLARRP